MDVALPSRATREGGHTMMMMRSLVQAATLAAGVLVCAAQPRGRGKPRVDASWIGRYRVEGRDGRGRYEGRLIVRRGRGGLEAVREQRGERLTGPASAQESGGLVVRFEDGTTGTYKPAPQGLVGRI